MRNDEMKNEIYEIKKWENKIKRKDLKNETNRYKYDFQQFEAISSFGDSIYDGKISIDEVDDGTNQSISKFLDFSNKSRPR